MHPDPHEGGRRHRATARGPHLAAATTVALWASAFPAIRVALPGYGPAGLSFARLAVASATLALLAPFVGIRRPARTDLPRIAGCAVAGMSSYQLLLNLGQTRVPAGTASLLVATVPAFSVLLAALFLRERITARAAIGTAIALAGSAMIALAGGDSRFSLAAWAVLAAAVAQASYHTGIKPLLRRYTGVEVASYATWVGTLLLLPLAPRAVSVASSAAAGTTWAVLFLGALPSAAGFVAWSYAVARTTVTVATAALYLIPIIAMTIAFVWLDEVPGVIEVTGGLVIIVGVATIGRRATARRNATPSRAA